YKGQPAGRLPRSHRTLHDSVERVGSGHDFAAPAVCGGRWLVPAHEPRLPLGEHSRCASTRMRRGGRARSQDACWCFSRTSLWAMPSCLRRCWCSESPQPHVRCIHESAQLIPPSSHVHSLFSYVNAICSYSFSRIRSGSLLLGMTKSMVAMFAFVSL